MNFDEENDDKDYSLTPPELRSKATNAEKQLVPKKSRAKYVNAYNAFYD